MATKRKEIYQGFKKIGKDEIPDLKTYMDEQVTSHRAALAGNKFKISVGTDSKFHPRRGGWSVTYATIIAFTFGNNGTHLIARREIRRGEGKLSLFDRLWQEVEMTVNLAVWVRENIGLDPEVHLDVNPKKNAGSNVLFEAAKGYAESMGFVTECKPDSPVAMCAADHLVRNKLVL